MSILVELSNTVQKQVEKEYEYSPVRGVAHQLMDIVGQNEQAAAIVLEDLNGGSSIKECERKIKAWVDKNHKGNSGYCPPHIADGIIREYFGLPKQDAEPAPAPQPKPKAKSKTINLEDFL